jgi:hypothetical protein
MKIGRCRLCLRENQELQNSHFISAAIYQVCKDGTKQPVMVGGESSRHTGGQIADELLCRDCEQRFSKNAEAWTIANMARQGAFPLQSVLANNQPLLANNCFAAYGQQNGIDLDQLVYFALSIFWRASVHQWLEPDTDRPIATIALGEYEEPIRRFLADGSPWPSNIVILVSVWPYPNPPLVLHTPVAASRDGFTTFMFSIPGLTFTLAFGSEIPGNLRRICSHSSSERLIFSSTDQALYAMESYAGKIAKSPPKGKLATEYPELPAKSPSNK